MVLSSIKTLVFYGEFTVMWERPYFKYIVQA